MFLRPGATVGPFKIESLLGKGGMGEVFSALDPRLDRRIAIKVLPPEFARDPDRLRRFQAEAKALALLNHPNIVVVYEVGTQDGSPYLVSELLEGRTLREELNSGPIPLRKAIEFARQIGHGLAAAHTRGIIHRDLKPENVFVTKDGRVKLLDFGLAKLTQPAIQSQDSQTGPDSPTLLQSSVPGLILGTIGYMSPEQVRGELSDHRSDLFAFGCILYEMLSGKRAFSKGTAAETMAAILNDEPAERLDLLNPSLDRVTRRCLEKRPDLRFQSASDLAFALDGATAAASDVALPSPLRPKPSADSARFVPWALASLCLAGFIGALVFKSRPESKSIRPSPIPRQLPLNLGRMGQASVVSDSFYPSISPDGQKIAFADAEGLWLYWLNRVTAPALLAKGENIRTPFWSPRSSDVAYFDGRTLARVALTGSRPEIITTVPDNLDAEVGAAWLGNDQIILGGRQGLYHVPARGGEVALGLSLGTGERGFESLTSSPGRDGVLFFCRLSDRRALGFWKPGAARKIICDLPPFMVGSLTASKVGGVVFDRWDGARGLWSIPLSWEKLQAIGEPRRISDLGYLPSMSEDGTIVCATGGRQDDAFSTRRLVSVNRSGVIERTVSPALPGLSGVHLSPDGLRVVAQAGESVEGLDIWLINLASGQADRLTQNGVQDSLPAWWANGHEIVFCQPSGTDGVRVFRRSLQALGHEEPLVPEARGYCWAVCDSAKAMVLRHQNKWGYVSFALNHQNVTALPDALQGVGQPTFSPDGRSLAYRSSESGPGDIYVVDFPEFTNLRQVSRGGGFNPQWHPNGTEIFFLSSDGRSLMSSRQPTGGSDFELPSKLFDLPPSVYAGQPGWPNMFAVSGDGLHFFMVQHASASIATAQAANRANAVLIENWCEELPGQK